MWHGVPEYLALVAVVGLIVHCLVRQFAVAGLATAALSSLVIIGLEAWVADFQVNPGWLIPMIISGFVIALPAGFLAGIPRLLWRKYRQPSFAEIYPPGRPYPPLGKAPNFRDHAGLQKPKDV